MRFIIIGEFSNIFRYTSKHILIELFYFLYFCQLKILAIVVIHTNLDNLNINNPILTIGVFDGVHLGHQKVLDRLKNIAKEKNGDSVVLTLWLHPRIVLDKDIE